MAWNRKGVIDTVIVFIFRYELVFGLTTHVYDTKTKRLVRSRAAYCYSLLLHVTLVILLLFFCLQQDVGGVKIKNSIHFYKNLVLLAEANYIVTIFVSMGLQWTLRANAPTLFNEIIQIWNTDVAHLQACSSISRQAGKLTIFATIVIALAIVNGAFGAYYNAMNSFSIVQSVYIFLLSNIIIAVMFLFWSGLVFSQYLFRILNYNLTRAVEDISSLRSTRRPRYAFRHKIFVLEKHLDEIGRTHAQLQKWVIRFKNLYQVELLLILISFLVSQVFIMFFVCVLVRGGRTSDLQSQFLVATLNIILTVLNPMILFYICDELLDASHDAGQIMKDLPTRRLSCIELERCVEMMCFQFKREKLRLSICGLVDLEWSKGFAMTEAALLHIIILIQWDYRNFWK